MSSDGGPITNPLEDSWQTIFPKHLKIRQTWIWYLLKVLFFFFDVNTQAMQVIPLLAHTVVMLAIQMWLVCFAADLAWCLGDTMKPDLAIHPRGVGQRVIEFAKKISHVVLYLVARQPCYFV